MRLLEVVTTVPQFNATAALYEREVEPRCVRGKSQTFVHFTPLPLGTREKHRRFFDLKERRDTWLGGLCNGKTDENTKITKSSKKPFKLGSFVSYAHRREPAPLPRAHTPQHRRAP